VAAGLAWLKAVEAPETGNLVLDAGPRVLGWTWAREIEERYSAGPTRAALTAAVAAGEARCANVGLAARIINAALAEIALSHREVPVSDIDAAAMVRAVVKGVAGAG
jgi:hypothetical protein